MPLYHCRSTSKHLSYRQSLSLFAVSLSQIHTHTLKACPIDIQNLCFHTQSHTDTHKHTTQDTDFDTDL